MKILIYNLTTTIKHGGVETFTWEIAKALVNRGHTVYIFGGKPKENFQFPKIDNVIVKTFPFISRENFRFVGSRLRKFIERISFFFFAFPTLLKTQYDYIYIHKSFDLPMALFLKKVKKIKVIFSSHGTEFFPGYKYFVKKVDHFFACSNFNAEQVFNYCGIRPKVLYNGVNTELFRPLPADTDLKKMLHINDEEKVIINVCRLVGWKGLNYSIKAFAELVNKGYKCKYLIIGDGEKKKELQETVKNLKLKEKVIFLGKIPNQELPRYYSISDIAVFPSIADETFGISIAEAMACGVPVISTTVGGIPEVVCKNCGFLVSPKDYKALAEKIEFLIINEEIRKKFGINARKITEKNFKWDVIIEKFEKEFINA